VCTKLLFIACSKSKRNEADSSSICSPAAATSDRLAAAPTTFHTPPNSTKPRQYSAAIEKNGISVLCVVFTLAVVRNKSASSLPRGLQCLDGIYSANR
jgi:hypothetical protein